MSDRSQNGRNDQDDTGGLGQDGTIPAKPDGVAAGYQPGGSNFEQEEDVEGVTAADADDDADADDEIKLE